MHHKIGVEEKHILVQERIPLANANNSNNYIFGTATEKENPVTGNNPKRVVNVSEVISHDGSIYSNRIVNSSPVKNLSVTSQENINKENYTTSCAKRHQCK